MITILNSLLAVWLLAPFQQPAHDHAPAERIAAIARALNVRPGAIVADIGAGGGDYTMKLAPLTGGEGRIVAVDISDGALARLRTRIESAGIRNVEIVKGAVDDPHLPSGALDAALIVNAYHEMTEHRAMLRHIKAALKPGGRLVILEPLSGPMRPRPREEQTARHEIAPEFVTEDLREAGFDVVALEDPFRAGPVLDGRQEWLVIAVPAGQGAAPPGATFVPELEIVMADRPVPGLPSDRPLFEPHLAASPSDAGHLLGAAIVADPAAVFGSTQNCVAIATFDAGRTWHTHTFDLTQCGDPWVAIGAGGTAWFSALGMRAGAASNRMYVYRSADGGRTWDEQPTDFGAGHDHQTLIAARPSAPRPSDVYIVSGLGRRTEHARFHAFVARSVDGGRNWLPPLVATPSNLNLNTLAGGVLPDGTLLVPLIDSQRPGATGMLARRRAWLYRASPDLATLSPPLLISEECTSNSGFGSLITIPGSTRALFVCVNAGQSVVVHRSDDGSVWADAAVLEAPIGSIQRVPAAAATNDGIVAFSWMDSRQAGPDCFVLRAAVSRDGGATFGPSQALSTAPTCPQSGANGAAGKRWKHGGDYSGFAAGADGRFHALWADSRNGMSQLRFMTAAARKESQ